MRPLLLIIILLFSRLAFASSNFVVEDIRVDGLQRVSAGSVFSAFPINVGDKVDTSSLAAATRQLFKVGLFTDISLAREGSVLIVKVVERPSISEIEVSGNKNIEDEDLLTGLRGAGLAEGEVFQRSTLERIELEILRSYVAQGRYNASVDAGVEDLPRNRVAIKIEIKEGAVSSIDHINVVGNKAFVDEDILKLMELELGGFWAGIFGSDKYSKQKLNGDLERIRSHYLDNGYIKFSIESTQVSVSPDKEKVFITINMAEGAQYTIKEVLLKGDLKVEEQELRRLVYVKDGDVFSREKVTNISDLITRRLGAEGYTFASVNAIPEPHDDNTATVTFYVEPGSRTYVNRINFLGNVITSDEVLRQRMLQMEGAAASTDLIEESKARLERSGFFKTVTVETPIVPGTDDKIDVNYTVEEQPTGSLSATLGYTDGDGVTVGASVTERNFWGTGRSVTLGVNRSESIKSANLSYTNPYFTIDGVSRGFSLFYRETDYEDDDDEDDDDGERRFGSNSSYASDQIGGSVSFGYPIDLFSRLKFGFEYSNTTIHLPRYPLYEYRSFLDEYGDTFNFFTLLLEWNRTTYNRNPFPTRGMRQSLSGEFVLPEISDYSFFKIRYSNDRYFPISSSQEWALHLDGTLAFGQGYDDSEELPFFENYRTGGITTVRGYESRSLGPRSQRLGDESDPDPIGGNLLVQGSVELIFPFAVLEERSQVRSLLFFDFGNVFDTTQSIEPDLSIDELRMSAGLGLSWITPIGPLTFSVGKAINDKPGDETEFFQFALGQLF